MIYLDNAATTLHKPETVPAAVLAAMSAMGNASRGGHGTALSAARTIYGVRERAARLFHCRPDHVAFTANATEALNYAIQGAIPAGSHVITTDAEHNSVLRPLHRLEDAGRISLSYVPADRMGRVDQADFARLLRSDTRAIVCAQASNVTGNTVDIAALGKLARERGILLMVDASQSAGCMDIDMVRMGIDLLCFTGHKGLYGPQGTGGLCLREGVNAVPLKEGGTGVQSYSRRQPEEYPTRLEAGTLNGHGLAGLSAALDFVLETGPEAIGARERNLARRFWQGVRDIPGVTCYGDFSRWDRRTGIVSLNIQDWSSGEVADVLDREYGIAVRPGAHCAPRLHQAMGTVEQGAVRFSFSWFNTEEEADAAARAVA